MRQGGALNNENELGVDAIPLLFASSHAFFGLFLQFASYINGFSSAPEPIRFGLLDWILWPFAQLPLVIESGLLLLLWSVLRRQRVLQLGFWLVVVVLNLWLCLDLLVFRAFFEHWIPGVVDAPLLMAVLWGNVFSQADGVFFAALATWVALSAISYQWLLREPPRFVSVVCRRFAKRVHASGFRLAIIGWVSLTVIVTAQTDYYKLTESPLVSWVQRQALNALSVPVPELPVKVTVPRLAQRDVSVPDPLDGGLRALGLRTTTFGARNIVYLKIVGVHASERGIEAIRARSPALNELLSTSLTLDQVYRPSLIAANASQGDVGSLFSNAFVLSKDYFSAEVNVPDGSERSGAGAAGSLECESRLDSTVNLFSRQLAQSQAASRALFFAAEIDFDWAVRACQMFPAQPNEQGSNLESLLRGIRAALQTQGVDVATWFVIHIYNNVTNPSATPTSADLRESVTLVAPDQLTAMFHSSRVAYVRELGLDIESLLFSNGSPLHVLGSFFQGQNVFFVRDAPRLRWGVRDGPWWFAANVDGTDAVLFQLDVDSGETTNLAASLPKLSDYYQRLTVAWFAQAGPLYGIQPAGFVTAKRGLLPQRYANVAGPKSIALTASQQTIVQDEDAAFVRIHPQDPLVATIFLLPYGAAHDLQIDWSLPGGAEERYPIVAQKGWTSLWAFPGGDIPMAEGVGRVAVRSGDVVLVARDFLITSAVPATTTVKHSLRELRQLQVGMIDRVNASAAEAFVSREQLYADEIPVVRAVFSTGKGFRLLRTEWISPGGVLYAREAGLRQETNELWIKMRANLQPLESGTWKVLVQQDDVVLGSVEFVVGPRPVQ